jgi:hypothetical protein
MPFKDVIENCALGRHGFRIQNISVVIKLVPIDEYTRAHAPYPFDANITPTIPPASAPASDAIAWSLKLTEWYIATLYSP